MRLISDEEVKELLKGLDSLPWEEEVDDLVGRIPTAYDVDAVVRELEQDYRDAIKIYGNDANGEYYYGVTRALHRAIQVVKRGGRNE